MKDDDPSKARQAPPARNMDELTSFLMAPASQGKTKPAFKPLGDLAPRRLKIAKPKGQTYRG